MEKPATFVNHSVYPTPEGWKHPLSFERKPEKIDYPKAKTATVEGATVFYLPDTELPLIDLTLLVKAGAVDVPLDETGLTQVLDRSLIRGGADKFSPTELALALDENAIQLAVSIGQEETVIHLSVMKDDWDKGLALLEDVVVRPRFDPEVLQVAKSEEVTSLERQGEDAEVVGTREATIWHFKGHPYGRDPLQGLETIPSISRDDVWAFIRTYFVPSNMVAAVSGDIEMDKALKGLKSLFQAFPKERGPERNLDEPPETPPVLALVHKPGQVQSQVVMLLPSVKRTDPDFWKMSLLMDIFGGMDSLLSTRLRDNLGLVYAAWFYQTFKWKAGMLVGYIGCKGDNTAQAIDETIDIMTSLREDVPGEEFEQKRLDALNGFVFNVDTPAALAEAYGRYRMHNEPLDTLERIQDAFIRASKEELRVLGDRLLTPGKLQVFVVGDKTTMVRRGIGSDVTLEEDLKALAEKVGLPFKEMALR
jgi:zinc protease